MIIDKRNLVLKGLHSLKDLLLTDPDARVRSAASEVLAELEYEEAENILVSGLKGSDIQVKQLCSKALSIGRSHLFPQVFSTLCKENDPETRQILFETAVDIANISNKQEIIPFLELFVNKGNKHALELLFEIPGSEICEFLVKTAQEIIQGTHILVLNDFINILSSAEGLVCSLLIGEIMKLTDEQVDETLILKILGRAESLDLSRIPWVQENIRFNKPTEGLYTVQALSRAGKEAIPILIEILENSEFSSVREASITALNHIFLQEETLITPPNQILDLMVNDQSFLVRIACINALEPFIRHLNVETEFKTVLEDEDKLVVRTAYRILFKNGFAEFLEDFFTNKILNPFVTAERLYAARIIKDISEKKNLSPSTVESLGMTVLRDENPRVRAVCANALGYGYGWSQVETLMKATNDSVFFVRTAACYALGELKYRPAADTLLQRLLHEDDMEVKRAASWALSRMPEQKIIQDLLTAALENNDSIIRKLSVQAIGKMKAEKQVQSLIVGTLIHALQNDSDVSVRAQSAEELSNFKGKVVLQALLRSMDDENSGVRATAIWSLSQRDLSSHPAIMEKLFGFVDDPSFDVRETMIESISKQIPTNEIFEVVLKVSQDDKDPSVRYCSAIALGELIQKL